MNRISFFLIALIAAAGCGDDDGGARFDARRIDGALPPDSPIDCVASANYAAPTADDQGAFGGDVTAVDDMGFLEDANYYWQGLLANNSPQVALVQMAFWVGFGGLEQGLTATSYPISGDELSFSTCGICTLLFADLTIDSTGRITAAGEIYFQTGGTVNLTSVPMGNDRPAVVDGGWAADARPTPDGGWGTLAGTISGMTFGEVNQTTGAVISGGCTTALADTTVNDSSVTLTTPVGPRRKGDNPIRIVRGFITRDGAPVISK